MIDILIIAVIVAIVGGIGLYLYRAKRSGVHCIGCPHGKQCSGSCGGACHCGEEKKQDSNP